MHINACFLDNTRLQTCVICTILKAYIQIPTLNPPPPPPTPALTSITNILQQFLLIFRAKKYTRFPMAGIGVKWGKPGSGGRVGGREASGIGVRARWCLQVIWTDIAKRRRETAAHRRIYCPYPLPCLKYCSVLLPNIYWKMHVKRVCLPLHSSLIMFKRCFFKAHHA